MLVTNQEFLKTIEDKKVFVAFDISGSTPTDIQDKFVTTMIKIRANCKCEFKPRMLTFDHKVYEQKEYHMSGRVDHHGHGGTDVDRLYEFIDILHEQPDVLLIVSDGLCPWPKQNKLPHVEQYILLLGNYVDAIPDYVSIVEKVIL